MSSPETITIPSALLPRDGRFGAGPSKVRAEQLSALLADGTTYETRNRVTLCRCGASKNKPLCDGSHGDVGFHDAL